MELQTYTPDPKTDFLLLDWYDKLVLGKEFYGIFSANVAALSQFFASFQKPTTLVYLTDEAGIWAAAWCEPSGMNAGFFGVWMRSEQRQTRNALAFFLLAVTHFFTLFDNLVAAVRNPQLHNELRRFGAVEAGSLPRLFYTNEDASVFALTKQAFIDATQQMRLDVDGRLSA